MAGLPTGGLQAIDLGGVAHHREAGVGPWVGRALTWEGGTRSKFFPSIRLMCFRAWEVIWCLSRKENWQPSRMQWKWLFTWLYLQPVDTARSAMSPAGPGSGRLPCVRHCSGLGGVGPQGRWLWGKGSPPMVAILRGGLIRQLSSPAEGHLTTAG